RLSDMMVRPSERPIIPPPTSPCLTPPEGNPMPSKRAAKRPPYRLKEITDEQMTALQRALRDAIYSGPRGVRQKLTGPFQIWLNAPELGHLAQALGAHVRYKTSLSPRLSETAICTTAQIWKAQ